MAAQIPRILGAPSEIQGGDTVVWDIPAVRNYPNSSWNSTLTLRRTGTDSVINIGGVPRGTGWRITLSAATTSGMDPGYWDAQFQLHEIGGGMTAHTAWRGSTVVIGALYSTRRSNKPLEDWTAINEALRALASGDAVQSYSIGDTQINRYSLSELLQLREVLRHELDQEQVRRHGDPGLSTYSVRFSRA